MYFVLCKNLALALSRSLQILTRRFLVTAFLCLGCISALAQSGSAVVETIGGAFEGYADGGNNVSQFHTPMGLALDGAGNLLIADFENNAIRSLRLSDARVSTLFSASAPVAVAATTNFTYVLNQGSGFISTYDRFGNRRENLLNGLASPTALTVDTNGNVYVAEGGGVVRRISSAGNVTATYRVTEGIPDLRGVAVFPDGKVAVSDQNAKVIWLFNDAIQRPVVLAGTKFVDGFADGPPGIAKFRSPGHLALGPNNSLVVADRFNHRVRAVSCDGNLTTLYGVDSSRWEQSPGPDSGIFPGWFDGSIEFAESRDPVGVAVGPDGTVYGSEAYYHLIRAASGLSFPSNCGGPANVLVPTPILTPNSGFFPNGITISITASNTVGNVFGPDTKLHYTLDGTEPTTNSPSINLVENKGELTLPGPVDLAALKVRAFVGIDASPVVSALPTTVPSLSLTPNSGYYPMGVRIVVTTTNTFPAGTELYYTINGTEPNTNSFFAPIEGGQGIIRLRGGQADLRSLRVKAFLGPNAGQTAAGQAVSFDSPTLAGEVGIPIGLNSGSLSAGVGSTIVVPVVANLRAGQFLRSLQFVAELVSLGQAPPPGGANQLRVLPMSNNDFIQVAAASPSLPNNVFSSVQGPTNNLAIAYVGTNTSFTVANFATVALLAVPISTSSRPGDRYRLNITRISGTSDGVEQTVLLRAMMPSREIVIENKSYLVGDTSPASWYNAGDFGNKILDNADVNNIFYASLGFRIPFSFTDVFNAMDAFPEDSDGITGGDQQIRFLDWQTILRRSLGFNQNNWLRQRDANGQIEAVRTNLPGSGLMPAEMLSATSASTTGAWQKDASISAGVVERIPQTAPVSVPVYVQARPGAKISGLQFVARVRSASGTGPVSSVRFVTAEGLPSPSAAGNSVPGLGTINDSIYCSWNLDSFNPGIEGKVQIGALEFQIPSNAQSLQAYEISFSNADGASSSGNLEQYDFESFRGAVWVNSPALTPQDTVSDEWKTTYFGSPDAAEGRAELDADADGFTNLQEYQSGLNPARADWRISFPRGRFAFRFLREANKKYKIQKSSDLRVWLDASPIYTGPASLQEYIETSVSGKTNQFYRVIEMP